MTALTPNDRFVSLSPAAGTTVLAYDFELLIQEGMTVIRIRAGVKTALALGVDFSFPGGIGDEAGGSLTLAVASLAGDVYQLIGAQPEQRLSDFLASQRFDSAKMNADLDALTVVTQEHRREINRGWKSGYGVAGGEIAAGSDGELAKFESGNLVPGPNVDQIEADAAAATAARDAAQKWATEAEDVAVNDGVNPVGNSAFHWMRKALASATSAAAYAAAAAASAIAAAASAASINLPPIVANTFLQAKPDATGYLTKTATEVRNALAAAVFVADRTAVKALDPTKDKAATTYGEGLGLNGRWIPYLTASLSATDQAAAAIDTTEAIYLTSGSYTWVRLRDQGGKINAKWCGAKGDNLTNDTASTVAALALAAQLGASVYAPAGVYRVNSAIAMAAGAAIFGDGPTLTIFRTTSATANVFTINGVSCGLYGLRIDATGTTRSAGWFVDLTSAAANFRMINFTMAAPFEAVRIADGVGDALFANGRIDDTVAATGRSVRVGSGTGTGPVLIVFSNVNFIAPSGAKPLSHIALFNCGDISLIGCSLLYGGYNLEIAPGAAQGVYSVKATNCYFDQAGTSNIRIVPTGTGIVRRGVFVNNWISAAGTHNVDIEPASTATVDGLTFSCNEVFGGAYGYYMTGISGNLTGINISNEMIAGSSSVGIAMDTVTKAQISNNIIGSIGGFGGVATGISTFGTMSKVQIVNNDLDGATTKINTAGATFTNNSRIEGNLGYNPVGAVAAATAGASPFTYTAGTSPETIYFKQTATNTATITQGGQQIATLANASTYYPVDLGPNESVVVTWATTAPTYTKMIH